MLLTHDGATCLVERDGKRYYHYSPIRIGSNVFIGVNSIIMPGVTIGDNAVVAAGFIVTKSISNVYVVTGVPAKTIMTFNQYSSRVTEKYTYHDEINFKKSYRDRIVCLVLSDKK